MSLYIRLYTNFFSHVKTLRLKAAIGNDAFWIPPRLWVYAAEHRPDGNLSNLTAEEIAMLVGYSGDAQALLQALLKVCFLDANPLRIHGWAEHNGFHQSFAARASKAAKARWKRQEKIGQEMTGDEKKRDEMSQALLDSSPSNAPSIQDAGNHQGAVLIPETLATVQFKATWALWLSDRKARKKPVTQSAATMQLKKLSEMGVEKAIQCIEQSIANGWQGLFEVKTQNENYTRNTAVGNQRPIQPVKGSSPVGGF